MQNRTYLRIAGASTPYIAVAVGLFLFRNAFMAVSIYYVGILIFIVLGIRGGVIKRVFSGWNTTIAFIAVLAGGLSGAVIFIMWDFAAIEGVNLAKILTDYGLVGKKAYVFAALAIIVNPLLEEIFWRGCLGGNSNKPEWVDAAFAGYHVPALLLVIQPTMAALAFAVLCVTGWVLRLIKYKLGGNAHSLLSTFGR